MYDEILKFWFEECDPKQWFIKDPAFDQRITEHFGGLHQQAIQGELFHWRRDIGGRLAEIIVLDQFSRNMYRNDKRSFRYDEMALVLAQEAVNTKLDHKLSVEKRAFLYMPFMHSESLLIHQTANQLFRQPGLEDYLDYEKRHQAIIARFGRYPHRNKILDRPSTTEEIAFLKQPGSSF